MSDPVTDPTSVPWWATLISGAGSAGLFAAVTTWISPCTMVEVAELDAETKRRKANVNERETTGERILSAWKLTLSEVKLACDEVRAVAHSMRRTRRGYRRPM
jgi:hypothetical protein